MELVCLTLRKIHAFQNVKQCYFKASINTVLTPVNLYRSGLHLISFCHTYFGYKSNSAHVIPTVVNGIMYGVQNKCLVRLENFILSCIVFDGGKKTLVFLFTAQPPATNSKVTPSPKRTFTEERETGKTNYK